MLIIGILVFIGQTYEFILYLIGKKDNELTDDEREIFNKMKAVIDNNGNDNKNKQEYIYDDNNKTNGVIHK